jgi:hypothetical protein
MSTHESIGFFVDPETGEVLDESVSRVDAHGRDIVGEDEHGFWWGTERACWKLEHSRHVVRVTAIARDGTVFDAWFLGSEKAALRYARRWGVAISC